MRVDRFTPMSVLVRRQTPLCSVGLRTLEIATAVHVSETVCLDSVCKLLRELFDSLPRCCRSVEAPVPPDCCQSSLRYLFAPESAVSRTSRICGLLFPFCEVFTSLPFVFPLPFALAASSRLAPFTAVPHSAVCRTSPPARASGFCRRSEDVLPNCVRNEFCERTFLLRCTPCSLTVAIFARICASTVSHQCLSWLGGRPLCAQSGYERSRSPPPSMCRKLSASIRYASCSVSCLTHFHAAADQ